MILGIDLDNTLITSTSYLTWGFVDGAIDTLHILRDRGYRFNIITARCPSLDNDRQISRVIMRLKKEDILIDSICYTSHNKKGRYAMNLGCLYLIDDQLKYLSDCERHGVIPVHLAVTGDGDINTISAWSEILTIVP